jgi:hypothetical protein
MTNQLVPDSEARSLGPLPAPDHPPDPTTTTSWRSKSSDNGEARSIGPLPCLLPRLPTMCNPPQSRDAPPNPASLLLELILLHHMVDVATKKSLNSTGPLEYLRNFSRIEQPRRKFGEIPQSVAVTYPKSSFG